MRILVSICILVGTVSTGLAQGVNTTTRIAFDRTEHDFRIVPVGKELTVEYKVISAGYEPVVIYRVKPECSCTSVDYPKDPIAPGSFGIISVTYTPDAAGRFGKWIDIRSNAAHSPNQRLTFSGFAKQ